VAFVVNEEVGELGFEGFDFGVVADHDVGVVGVVESVVLVVGLGVVEAFEGRDFGDDRFGEGMRGLELGDVGCGDLALLVGGEEDGGAVGGSYVRTLAVELGGVVDYGEEDLEEFAVGNFGGVEDDFDGFGVAGGFGGDLVVGSGIGGASGIAGCGGGDALDALEDGLGSPEAAASEDGRLFAVGGGERGVECGRGEGAGFGAGAAGDEDEGGGDEVAIRVHGDRTRGEGVWILFCGARWCDGADGVGGGAPSEYMSGLQPS
jgi:hypothetical protein